MLEKPRILEAMADPLSIASGIAGLISLAETLLTVLAQYGRNAKTYSNEFASIMGEIKGVCEVLYAIRPVIKKYQTARLSSRSPMTEPEREGCIRQVRY